jgi:predicted metalloprotease with PDZ domain
MIQYSVRIDDPLAHYAAFRMRFARGRPGPVDVVLPSWVPGSYWVQDSAKHVVDLTAVGPDSNPLPVERIDKARWRISGAGDVEVRYRVYGHAMVTEALDVSEEHLFLNGTVCLLYVDGRKEEACELAIDRPDGWRVVTELEEVGDHPFTLRAPNYDELIDAPVDVGTPTVLTIHPGGIRHRISLCGAGGNYEAHRIEADLTKIVEAAMKYVGETPLKGYTFFYHLHEISDGGLEHLTSNSCVIPRLSFRPEPNYQRFLWLSSHEYFHLYNVKRIHPEPLGPFDYTKEVYTRLLWLMEGTTDYVSLLLLRRAGLFDPAKYLEKVAGEAKKLLAVPGRHHQSLEESSFLAWIDFYRPREESGNRSISYYTKGHLVSMCLDLELRERSEQKASLQDVLRRLWSEYGRVGRGIPEGAFPEIVAKATGVSIEDFARRYIAGTEEVDLDHFARFAGLTFGPVPPTPESEADGVPGDLGADYRVMDHAVRITTVRDGGPGRRAGLSPGDELLAVDGVKIVPKDFDDLLKRFPPGSTAELTFFRRGWLTRLPVTFGKAPPEKYKFRAMPDASPRQRGIYEAWLEAAWEPPKPEPAK